MATWQVDTTYAALKPTPQAEYPRLIARRWKEVHPWVLRVARLSLGPVEVALKFFKERHEERLIRLLRSCVTMKAIRAGYLDDPTVPPMQFDWELKQAVQRHENRLKGKRRNDD